MNVVLVMFRENGERRSFSLTRDVTVVGRREDAHFRIPLTDVSRKHCRLVINGNSLFVEDLGSSNGTYHNGQRVQEAEVHPGDTLRIGPVQFIVQIDGVPPDTELGGTAGSGLQDAAATIVTPSFAPPPPLPPGFSPPEQASAPTIDDIPEPPADDVLLSDALPEQESSEDAEPVTEPFFGEPSAPAADDALVAEPEAAADAVADAEPEEEVSLDDLEALEPEAEDLPDFETSPPTAPEEVAAEKAAHQAEPEAEPEGEPEAEPAADEGFEITDEETPAEDDVIIDFDLPDDSKH